MPLFSVHYGICCGWMFIVVGPWLLKYLMLSRNVHNDKECVTIPGCYNLPDSLWSSVSAISDSLSVFCIPETFPDSVLWELGSVPALASWIGVGGLSLHCSSFCHIRSGRDPSVNNSFTLLPQLEEVTLLVSRMSRVLVRHVSPVFAFTDASFIVLSSTALWRVKQFMIQKPDS